MTFEPSFEPPPDREGASLSPRRVGEGLRVRGAIRKVSAPSKARAGEVSSSGFPRAVAAVSGVAFLRSTRRFEAEPR